MIIETLGELPTNTEQQKNPLNFANLDDVNRELEFLSGEESRLTFYELYKEAIFSLIKTNGSSDHAAKIKKFLNLFGIEERIYKDIFEHNKVAYHTFTDYRTLVVKLDYPHYHLMLMYIKDTINNILANKKERQLLFDEINEDEAKKHLFIGYYIATKLDLNILRDFDDVKSLLEFLTPGESRLNFYELNENQILNSIINNKKPNECLGILLECLDPDAREKNSLNFCKKQCFPKTFVIYQALTMYLNDQQYKEAIIALKNTIDQIMQNDQDRILFFKHLQSLSDNKILVFIKHFKDNISTDRLRIEDIAILMNIRQFYPLIENIILNKVESIRDYFSLCAELALNPHYKNNRNKLFEMLIASGKVLQLIKNVNDFLKFNDYERNKLFMWFKLKCKLSHIISTFDNFITLFSELGPHQQNDLYWIFQAKLFNNLLPKQIETCLTHFENHPDILKNLEFLVEQYVNTFKQCYKIERNSSLFFKSNYVNKLKGKEIKQQFTMIRTHAAEKDSRTRTVTDKIENQEIKRFNFS